MHGQNYRTNFGRADMAGVNCFAAAVVFRVAQKLQAVTSGLTIRELAEDR
jgi:hypothetical protein